MTTVDIIATTILGTIAGTLALIGLVYAIIGTMDFHSKHPYLEDRCCKLEDKCRKLEERISQLERKIK